MLCLIHGSRKEVTKNMEEEIKKIKQYHTKEERLAEYSGEDRVVSSVELEKELQGQKGKEIYKFLSKISTLDKFMEGFETGELTIVSGYTGHGKTSLCQSLTLAFLEADIKSLWFSYEMPARLFFSKFPSLPLFYLPRILKEKAIDWIEDRIIEAKTKYEIRVVMIDHLHFLVDLIKMKQPSLEIGTIVRSLKLLALKHNITLFLVAHTSMPRQEAGPGLADIRDSSFITQEADSVIAIHRKKSGKTDKSLYGNESLITILKSRRTGAMGRKINVLYTNKRFQEVSQEDYEGVTEEAPEELER